MPAAAQVFLLVSDSELLASGDLENVLKVAAQHVAEKEGQEVAATPLRLFKGIELPIRITPARGPSVELARLPRGKKDEYSGSSRRAAVACPIEACKEPGASSRRGFCERHWALVPPDKRRRFLADANDKQRLIQIVERAEEAQQ